MRIAKLATYGVLAICSMIFLSGCSIGGGLRFYPDEPRPQKEVALVLIHRHISLDSITREGQEKMELVGGSNTSELLAGKYALELRYVFQGTYRNEAGRAVRYGFQAEAGHVYYFYPEFPTQNTWRPAVLDIANETDYLKATGSADVNPEDIKKWVNGYFAGSRTKAQKEVHSTSSGVITIWR